MSYGRKFSEGGCDWTKVDGEKEEPRDSKPAKKQPFVRPKGDKVIIVNEGKK